MIALGKRPNQIRAAEKSGARGLLSLRMMSDPARTVRELTEGRAEQIPSLKVRERRKRGFGLCRWFGAAES